MPRRIGQIKGGEPPAGGQQVQAPQESPAAVCTGANGQGGKACSNLSNGEGRVRVNTRDAQSPARRSSPTQEETSSPVAVSCPPAAGACQPEVYTRGRGGCRVLCVHGESQVTHLHPATFALVSNAQTSSWWQTSCVRCVGKLPRCAPGYVRVAEDNQKGLSGGRGGIWFIEMIHRKNRASSHRKQYRSFLD
jgi:hypothetical protein